MNSLVRVGGAESTLAWDSGGAESTLAWDFVFLVVLCIFIYLNVRCMNLFGFYKVKSYKIITRNTKHKCSQRAVSSVLLVRSAPTPLSLLVRDGSLGFSGSIRGCGARVPVAGARGHRGPVTIAALELELAGAEVHAVPRRGARRRAQEPPRLLRDRAGPGHLHRGEMEHDKSGPGYTFDSPAVAGKMVDWSPAQFLTQLRPDVLKQLELEKHGVRKLFCLAFLASVDKMRLTAAKQKGKPFDDGVVPPLWDFVLTRGDGVMFAMHPSWKNFKCKVSQLKDHATIQRVQSSQTRKLRDWVAECYPIRGHGLYQEGQDPVRDEHRRKHLASNRWKRWGAPAVAEESAGQSGAPAVAGESEGQSAVAEQPGGATLTFGCGAPPASGSRSYGVCFFPRVPQSPPAVAGHSPRLLLRLQLQPSASFLQEMD